jgi:MFS family permease
MKKSKLIFIAGLGTLFESFDFYLFSLFAVALNYSFFGGVNKHSTLWMFLIFAVGYFARIVGALVFGYWGDKLGRIYSFKRTVVIMAISSIIIGFLPTYESIGILAVVFLITLRFIQGISYGGEESGANIIIMETFKKHQPLLVLCIGIMSTAGVFLSQLTYYILSLFFTNQYLMDYGWRIAYIFGGIILFHSYFARKEIAESDEYKLSFKGKAYKNTVREMFYKQKEILFLGILCLISIQMYWGVFMIYLPSYMTLKYGTIAITSDIYYITLFGVIIGGVIGAIIAEFVSVKNAYCFGVFLTLIIIVPFYLSLTYRYDNSMVESNILLFLISLAHGVSGVIALLMLSRRFPIEYRYTLVSTSSSISAFLFIGLPPFIFSYFMKETSIFYPMLVFGIGCVVQLIAVQLFYNKTEQFVSS